MKVFEDTLRIDLFNLHLPIEDKSSLQWISAYGIKLSEKLSELLREIGISKYSMSLIISNEFQISNSTVQKMVYERKFIPLVILSKVLEEWKNKLMKSEEEFINKKLEIQNHIELLKVNAAEKPINATKYLTENLCEIIGSHIADGSLNLFVEFYSENLDDIIRLKSEINKRFNSSIYKHTYVKHLKKYKFGITITSTNMEKLNELDLSEFSISATYQLGMIEEDRKSVENYIGMLSKCFGIKAPKIKNYHNAWMLNICNKIIGRMFRIAFGLPLGKKSHIVKEPEIIKSAPLHYRRAFARGVMTFDGTIELRGSIRLDVRSKRLRDDIKEILELDGIYVTNYDYLDGYTFYSSINLKPEIASKWLNYFVKGSEKWYKVSEMVHGFNGDIKSISEFESLINKIYPMGERTKVTINDIFNLVKNTKGVQLRNLVELSGITKSQLLGYIRLLIKMNVITKSGRNYLYNADITHWKVPNR